MIVWGRELVKKAVKTLKEEGRRKKLISFTLFSSEMEAFDTWLHLTSQQEKVYFQVESRRVDYVSTDDDRINLTIKIYDERDLPAGWPVKGENLEEEKIPVNILPVRENGHTDSVGR
jgi:hypothetical protein